MRAPLRALVFCVCAATSVAAQSQFNAQLPKGWTLLSPPDSRMSVALPGVPKPTTETGAGFTNHVYVLTTPTLMYSIVWRVYSQPKDVEQELDENRDSFAAAVKSRLLTDVSLTQSGISGREFTTEGDIGFTVSRVFASGTHSWQVSVLARRGFDDTRSAMLVLDSFKVVP